MEEDALYSIRELNCSHKKEWYTQRHFDIINGLEFKFKRCLSCHKIIEIEAKKFSE